MINPTEFYLKLTNYPAITPLFEERQVIDMIITYLDDYLGFLLTN